MGKITDGIPFLKITVAYIIGITTANLFPGMPLPAISAIILALLISAIFVNRIKTLAGNRIVSAILILVLFFGGYARQSASVQVPVLPEGEYYHHQLLGLVVIDDQARQLGQIAEIVTTPANDVYVVRRPAGPDLLLPAIPPVVLRVDLEKGEMHVHLLPGLLEE